MWEKIFGNIRVNDGIKAFKTHAPRVANPSPPLQSAITTYNRSSIATGAFYVASFVSGETALLTPVGSSPYFYCSLLLAAGATAMHGVICRSVASDFLQHLQSSQYANDHQLAKRLLRKEQQAQLEFNFA